MKYQRIIAPCSSSETSENDGTEDETSSNDTGPWSNDQLQGNCDNSDDMLVVMMVIMGAMKVIEMLIIIIMVMIMIM